MQTISKENLKDFLNLLAKEYKVLVPVQIEGTSKFAPYEESSELFLEENVVLPPKDIFFPQTEKMYKFKTIDKKVEFAEIPQDNTKQIIFGIRSCDMKSIECLDQVFLTKGFVDEFYKNKRERSVFISLACSKAAPTCFCDSMGINPQEAVLADIQAYDLGNKMAFEAKTQLGQELLVKAKELLKEEEITLPDFSGCQLQVDVGDVPEKLQKMFDHPIWEELSRKCIGCNICAFLCPTCHCFDIAQEVRGEDGTKIRCWDCCMVSEYTQMAAHQPRPSKKERVRNRFMHKLNYFVDRYGMLLCVGCGRCIEKCPTNMDITAIINMVKEAEIHE